MSTDELRTMYGKSVSFICKNDDEAFTDEYVLWLENQLMKSIDFKNMKNQPNTKDKIRIKNTNTFGVIKNYLPEKTSLQYFIEIYKTDDVATYYEGQGRFMDREDFEFEDFI